MLARTAASVVGVDANPEAHEHARLRYRRTNLRFARELVETFSEPADAVVFLQTIEHLSDPGSALDHFASLVAGDGDRGGILMSPCLTQPRRRARHGLRLHAQRADARAEGRVALGQPLARPRVPRRGVRSPVPRSFPRGAMFGLFHARKLRAHELALRLGWDALHPRVGLTSRFYGWFTPAISVSDFAIRPIGQARIEAALDFIAVCRV